MSFVRDLFLASIPVLLVGSATIAQTAPVSVTDSQFDFETAIRGTVVEHTFTLVNHTAAPVRIDKLRLTPPLMPAGVLREIPANDKAVLRIKLDTANLNGPYEGAILLSFTDPGIAEVRLTVTGRIVAPIEVIPPALFITSERGEAAQASVEILNHTSEPVVIEAPVHTQSRFTTRLETIEQGRRFQLTLVMNPNGPAGKNRDTIALETSSPAVPELRIAAYTYLRERVYTFPESVDLGALRLDDIRRNPELVNSAAQILMIYRKGTADFQVKVTTDVPELAVKAERGPLGDRYQITVHLAPDKVSAGSIRGSIVIETNDSEFPRLTVPVTGQIIGR